MTEPTFSANTRRFLVWMLLSAVSISSRGEGPNLDAGSNPPPEAAVVEEALALPTQQQVRSKPSPVAATKPAVDARTKRPAVATKSPPIHVKGHQNAGSQFDRIQTALLQENTVSAIDIYESILKSDPRNTDALLGLALIHLRKAAYSTAETLIFKALSISPRDGLALALLSPLRATENTAQEESRLRQALADQPDAAPLHFALANLYARQNRWREAQQAYFKATVGDRDHPDYLFNLAVSLEHISQPQAAAQYYQSALAASDFRPAAFSRTLATQRASAMERNQP